MNLKKILLQLSVPDVQEILAIDLDKGQGQGPGVYPGTPLAKKVKKALQPH